MKTQSNVVKPPTMDLAIRKYLEGADAYGIPYPDGKDIQAIGKYCLEGQQLTIYAHHGEITVDAGRLGHTGLSLNVRNVLGKVESYLRRTEYLKHGEHLILKYTKYWD